MHFKSTFNKYCFFICLLKYRKFYAAGCFFNISKNARENESIFQQSCTHIIPIYMQCDVYVMHLN